MRMSARVHASLEMATACLGETGKKWKERILVIAKKMKKFPSILWRTSWEIGRDDPRRIVHALKVGSALTLVSLLCLLEPFFEGIGQNAMWAVMTVFLVLEFSAGATLCKGLNRGLGTLLAGSLAFLIEYIAGATGHTFRAIFIGTTVFVIGAAATYTRFFPYVKKNYDYGVVIFILTFNLITVSSYRVTDVLKIAEQRLYTIAIGCAICLFMALLIFPIWSGEDLHISTAQKLEGLAKSIEVCVHEYFSDTAEEAAQGQPSDDVVYKCYTAVLDSKSRDDTSALYTSWEPRHSRHRKYPWQQYAKLGAVLRRFGYTVVALHGCLQTEIQTPKSCRALFKDPCIRVAGEVSKVLLELSHSIKFRRHCSPGLLSDHLHKALQDLNTAIKSQPRLFLGFIDNEAINVLALADAHARCQRHDEDNGVSLSSCKTDTSALLEWKSERNDGQSKDTERKMLRPQLSKIAITSVEFSEALPFAAFASLLVETVARLDNVIEEVEELGRIAGFMEFKPGDEVVVTCETPKTPKVDVNHNHLPSHAGD